MLNLDQQIRDVMLTEARAIEAAAHRLTAADAQQAIRMLHECTGKVIVLGIGKSGVIAQKIAQTLTSTGCAAMFLHPSDALHGGLGAVHENDVVIALSNSGETDELTALLPYLKHRCAPLIAIVGNTVSTLARHADVVLDAAVEREACPLDIAPTASTSVALAIGDALAMTLSAHRGLSPEDFARNHPAGRLGKRLTLKVQDIMHAGAQHPFVTEDATWLDAVTMITRGGLGAVNVVDTDGGLLGIITDGDVRRAIQSKKIITDSPATARDIMTPNPITTRRETLAYAALRLMEDRPSQISVLPVVDAANRAVGLLRLHDIVRSGL